MASRGGCSAKLGSISVATGVHSRTDATAPGLTGFDPNILDGGRGRAIDATRPRISVVDAATGALTVLMEGTVLADARFLWTQASNDQTAVLLHPAYFPDTALRAGDGKFSIDALNLDTGAVTSRALEVAVSGWPPPGTAGPLE